MMMEGSEREALEFRIVTTDLSDMTGKSHFTTELTFMKCLSGSARISIEAEEHMLTEGHSFILSEYVIFQVMDSTADLSVRVISIPLSLYYETVAGFDWQIFEVLLHSVPELYTVSDLLAADLLFENLCLLYDHPGHSYRRAIAMNLIACYIYEIYDLTLLHIHEESVENKKRLFSETIAPFYNLVTEYGQQNRSIDFYADKLNISSRYLYQIIHASCHITPKQFIDDVIIARIKQLLLTTSLTNQQIADRFTFPDQSAFGQYFKRCAGLSPSQFREQVR